MVRQPNGGTRKLPCYQITRDGFAFLAMGFTGKRAAQFKEAYINAFNQMEKQLSNPSVLSDVAHNASVLYSYISSIHQVWLQQLYPMLAKAESPLAVSLYDRINDAALLASLINLSLNPSEVRGANDPNIFKRFTNQTFRCPRHGQWYTTPAGHVLRVSTVDRECQKVVCEPLGRNYRVSMPLIAFAPEKCLSVWEVWRELFSVCVRMCFR